MSAPPTTFNSTSTRTVDPNYSVTTKDQALDLEKAFDKAFGPLRDAVPLEEPPVEPKEEPAPPAETPEPKPEETPPSETPPAETKPAETESKTPPAETPPPPTHPDDEPDEELDQLRLHPDSRPETVDAFRNARGAAKTARKASRELRDRVEAQDKRIKELEGTSRPVSDPQVQAELTQLRDFRQKHQVYDDTGYHVTYEKPVRDLFDDIIKDVITLAPDKTQAEEWEKQMRSAGPDRLDRNYWNEGVINQCSDPLHKDRIVRKVSQLLEAQEKRNAFRSQMAAEPDSYEKYRQQQASDYWGQFSSEAEDEAKKIVPTLGEWASPKDPALAKSTDERTAFEAHNKRYKEYEDLFQKALTEVATQGARGMTRVAMAAVHGEKIRRDLDTANAKITKLQADLKAAQDELNKIAGVRSKATVSSGTSTRTEGPKHRLGMTVEDAFKSHFGT